MSHRRYALPPNSEGGILQDLMKSNEDRVDDLVEILHDTGFTQLTIDFDDEEYEDLSTFLQFKLACAACARISMSCECVTVIRGVRRNHIRYISQNQDPANAPNVSFSRLRTIVFAFSFDSSLDGILWP
ncbi:unnamed protein product [Ectocarpus sp. 12 AP-2014]